MLNKKSLELKAISNKLLSLVSGGVELIENVKVKMDSRYKKRKEAAEAKRHRY